MDSEIIIANFGEIVFDTKTKKEGAINVKKHPEIIYFN